jgi:hypothetical protein
VIAMQPRYHRPRMSLPRFLVASHLRDGGDRDGKIGTGREAGEGDADQQQAATDSAIISRRLLDEREVTSSDDHMRFDLKTKASREQVLRALTDFTDARLQIWNRTLDPKTYELRDSGQTWAVARESTLDRRFGSSSAMTGPTRSRSAGRSWRVVMAEAERARSR